MHFKLILAFVEDKSTQAVLDASRRAGATGSTVINQARGEGAEKTKTFFGLTLEHDIRHLSRALLEGIAFRFRSLQEMLAEIGVEIGQVIASGGFTQSKLWMQVVADDHVGHRAQQSFVL